METLTLNTADVTAGHLAHLKAGDVVTIERDTRHGGTVKLTGDLVDDAGDGRLALPWWGIVRYSMGTPGMMLHSGIGNRLTIPAPPDPVCPWPADVVEAVARKLPEKCEDDSWDALPELYRESYRRDARELLALVPVGGA